MKCCTRQRWAEQFWVSWLADMDRTKWRRYKKISKCNNKKTKNGERKSLEFRATRCTQTRQFLLSKHRGWGGKREHSNYIFLLGGEAYQNACKFIPWLHQWLLQSTTLAVRAFKTSHLSVLEKQRECTQDYHVPGLWARPSRNQHERERDERRSEREREEGWWRDRRRKTNHFFIFPFVHSTNTAVRLIEFASGDDHPWDF